MLGISRKAKGSHIVFLLSTTLEQKLLSLIKGVL